MSLVKGEELAAHLNRVASLIKHHEHDSYEGSINWEATEEPDTYNVTGSYRVNDYGGQGSVHIFQDGEDRTVG